MASAVRKLTGVGGDIRKIARLLQKEAPPGHMLAYINQEEADLLKARGGSGEPHADTGVPSFQPFEPDTEFDFEIPGTSEPVSAPLDRSAVAPLDLTSEQSAAPQTSSPFADYERATRPEFANYQRYLAENTGPYPVAAGDNPQGIPLNQVAAAPQSAEGRTPFVAAAPVSAEVTTPSAAAVGAQKSDPYDEYRKLQAGTPTKPSFFEMSDETKKRLGIAGIRGIVGAYSAQQAAEQGRKAREDFMRLAKPYQDQGKKLIAQAQSGELTPVAQQTLQAAQAQAAQGAQARGGVGAQQTMAQVEALRQQLLQNQYDYGLKVSGIGDNIATGAIRTGLEADRYVNQLTNSYFTNIARTAYGQAPQVAGSSTYVREA